MVPRRLLLVLLDQALLLVRMPLLLVRMPRLLQRPLDVDEFSLSGDRHVVVPGRRVGVRFGFGLGLEGTPGRQVPSGPGAGA
jgi:hypothetical protein